jgi:hypothetical protein
MGVLEMEMEKDIAVLVETTNDEIFDAQAKHWPGLENFKKYVWKCRCHEPDCFRICVQRMAERFPTASAFEFYLGQIMSVHSTEEIMRITETEWNRYRPAKQEKLASLVSRLLH